MRLLGGVFLILISVSANAKSGNLVLSGTVPLKAEVLIQKGKITNNSSAPLQVKVQGRQPASEIQVVQVTAP